ncbi:MAG: hypothetical protein COB38_13310 [Gammaproteobacteria bacterium]|nr:MAG: hypothetical protein COB38_13310 [Gammaproteobacteria bacterium]
MNEQSVKKYLLDKPESTLDYPFGPEVAVFKIKNKMFATFGIHKDKEAINLKCEPNEALALCDIFESIIPGYHMNKCHWNTVYLDQSIPKGEIERMIDNSYALVVKGLKKPERENLILQYGREILGL